MHASRVSVAVVLARLASVIGLDLLAPSARVSELVEIGVARPANAGVRLDGVHADGVPMAVVSSNTTLVDQLLADHSGEALRIRTVVNVASFATAHVSRFGVRADGVWTASIGTVLTFILLGNAQAARLGDWRRTLVQEASGANTDVAIISVNASGRSVTVVFTRDALILEADSSDRMSSFVLRALTSVEAVVWKALLAFANIAGHR